MHTTRRASLLTFCIALLLLIGACSGGGGPVTANPEPDLSSYAASIEGVIYENQEPVTSGRVFVYDLASQQLAYEASIGTDGKYVAGVNAGQFLVFPVTPAGWHAPSLETDFSNYVNVQADRQYRMDIRLSNSLPAGEKVVFGFVTSSLNDKPVAGAIVTAAGRSTLTDGYGFYSMSVPSATTEFTITAEGFFDLHRDIRTGQAVGGYFQTPFFDLNPINTTGSSIGGIVRDVFDGTGLGGVRITLNRPEDPNFVPVRYLTNLGGEYRFYNLPEGIYKLLFERPGYISGTREGLVIKGQDDVILNMFMHPEKEGRASIWGYVNNASLPLPVGGAHVTVSNPLLGSYTTNSQSTGYYLIDDVIPSNYTIRVVAPSSGGTTFYEAAHSFQTVVEGSNRIDFALRFIDEGVLRGDVTIAGGGTGPVAMPPTGVQITAEKVGGPNSGVQFRTATDGKGQFVFNGIPAGVYLVRGSTVFGTTEVYGGEMVDVAVSSGATTNIALELQKQ